MNKVMQRISRSLRAYGLLAFLVAGIVGLFLLSSSSGVWATPGQSPLRQTIPSAGSIAGVVFNDLDGNGVQGPGESGLSGVTVTLDGATSTTTLENGAYIFTGVALGSHLVEETDPEGFFSTTCNLVCCCIRSGCSARVDFGDQQAGTVSGRVFNDLDGDGNQGTGEGGIAGVTVELRTMTGAVVATTTTASDGTYIFTGVVGGSYSVVERDPSGYVSTTPNTVSISVPAGGSATASFGDQPVSTVSGRVFDDLDGNGIQGPSDIDAIPGERGIGGVTISLLDTAGGLVDTTTTADDGSYVFTGVAAGSYSVVETDPSGYVSTTPNVVRISVPTGGSATVSFGDLATRAVSGRVFNDVDGDGEPDPGECGIEGVIVTLTSTAITTTTDFTGIYVFTTVTHGPHEVAETDPPGFASTSPGVAVIYVAATSPSTANFGDKAAGTLGGVVFNDADGDGVRDLEEKGLGGVTVELRDGDGALVDAKVTAGCGIYIFTGLSGDYTVVETDPIGFYSTTPNTVPVSVPTGGCATANFGDRVAGLFRIYLPIIMKHSVVSP